MRPHSGFVRAIIVCVFLGSLLLTACAGVSSTLTAPTPNSGLSAALAAGKAALEASNLAVAEQRYREAVAIDPQSAAAQLGLGNALVRQGKLVKLSDDLVLDSCAPRDPVAGLSSTGSFSLVFATMSSLNLIKCWYCWLPWASWQV